MTQHNHRLTSVAALLTTAFWLGACSSSGDSDSGTQSDPGNNIPTPSANADWQTVASQPRDSQAPEFDSQSMRAELDPLTGSRLSEPLSLEEAIAVLGLPADSRSSVRRQ